MLLNEPTWQWAFALKQFWVDAFMEVVSEERSNLLATHAIVKV